MNTQRGTFDTLGNAQRFLDQHADRLGAVATNGGRKKLDAIVATLAAHRSDQSEGAVSALALTYTKLSARRALLQDHLGAIAAIAQAELPNTPELAVVRRIPKGTTRINALLSRAEDVAKAVQPFANTFIANGLAPDFVAQLVSATKSVNDIANTHKDSRVKVVKASSGIQEELAAGRRQVRIIDKQVRTALRGDKALLDAWRAAIRLPSSTSATTPTPAPAPATPRRSTHLQQGVNDVQEEEGPQRLGRAKQERVLHQGGRQPFAARAARDAEARHHHRAPPCARERE